MLIKNTNERFGETLGTVEADSIDEVVESMEVTLLTWAREAASEHEDVDQAFRRISDEFRAGLEIVEE